MNLGKITFCFFFLYVRRASENLKRGVAKVVLLYNPIGFLVDFVNIMILRQVLLIVASLKINMRCEYVLTAG